MLDIKRIRDNFDEVKRALLKKMAPEDLDLETIISLDEKRRTLTKEFEEMQAYKNKLSKTKPTPEIISELKDYSLKITEKKTVLDEVEKDLQEKLGALPNTPADDVVPGGKENNEVVYTFGKQPQFNFEPKNHVDLATSLGLIDYERATKMSGSGFWCYTGLGALLEWALLSYFIDFHTKNGYRFMIPPFLLSEKSAYTSGHLPKFRDELFWTQDGTCLNATSEMMMGNYYREEILNGEDLPLKYCSYSACFRREAGSYRQEERGMIRGHQFNKIEMFVFCRPEDSWKMFEELSANAQKLVEGLGLHYQLSKLAAGDCSAAMAKTYDVEVWIPSMNIYKEVSSISNALDYQARRGSTRFKDKNSDGTEFVHTLNASGLATSRLLPAILEQFQQEDGSVIIPEVLRQYLPFKESVIKPIKK